VPVIRLETWIAAPIERCFDLMRDVEVHTQSTASVDFTVGLVDRRRIGHPEGVSLPQQEARSYA